MSTNTPNLAKDLFRIHKVITRSLVVGLSKGGEYFKQGFSSPGELIGYSSYIHCLHAVLDSHHTGEDLIAFPALRKVLPQAPYDRLANDHHGVEMLLANIPPAIADLAGNKPVEGVNHIVDTLTKISEIWYPHIKLEEKNFSEENLNRTLSFEEQKNIGEASSKHSQEHSNPPYWVVPFVLFNLEHDDRSIMASILPPVVMNELIPIAWKDQWSPMKPFLLD